MCGIAGYVGTRKLDTETLERCLRLMHHRGPDHAGYRVFEQDGRHIHLLAARLSIIDLDPRANQPFDVGGRTLVTNGELYNYREVRAGLEGLGERFTTASDTEVMARALGRHGAAALEWFEGMWAFAFHDEADGSLLLSRDRFGEKPLFLYRDETGLYFGSEPKLIACLLGRRLEPNLEHVRRYLVNGYRALWKTPQEFFTGLSELRAGWTLTVDRRGAEQESLYWSPALDAQDDAMSYDDAVASVRERVIRAVELRLRADVPLAFCLSGGIDSLSVIGTAKRVFGYDVHGFTIANEDERYEEADMVDLAVSELGLRHTWVTLRTDGFLDNLRGLVVQHDGPVATISYYAHWLLMEAIHEAGYRISVSGSAGDELFSGYYDHHLAYLAMVRGEPALHEASVAAWREHVAPLIRNPHLSNSDLFVDSPGFRDHLCLNADRYSAALTAPFVETFSEVAHVPDLLRNRMLNELFQEAVPVILREDDLNAMAFSIENRSPLLDRDLFEATLRVPTRHLIRDARAKALLRDAMRGIVPEPVLLNRRKVGFNAPIESLLDAGDPEVRGAVLADSPIYDLVRREAIEGLLERSPLPNSDSKFLFSFLNTKMFLEEFGG